VTKEDSTRVERLLLIAEAYEYNKPDSGLFYASKAIQLAQRLSYTSGEAWACIRVGEVNWVLGDYAQSMQYDLRATSLFQQMKRPAGVSSMKTSIGNLYEELGDYQQALQYYFDSRKMDEESPDDVRLMFPNVSMEAMLALCDLYIATAYLDGNRLDSALFFARRGYMTERKVGKPWNNWSYPALVLGNVYLRRELLDSALFCYRSTFKLSGQNDLIDINNGIASIYRKLHEPDSCRYYAKMAFDSAQQIRYKKGALQASELLSWVYEKTNPSEAIRYYKINAAIKDSLYNQQKVSRVNFLVFAERQKEQELQAAQANYQNRLKIYGLLAIAGIFVIIAWLLWRNNRHRQKAYTLLQRQKQETDRQRAKTEAILQDLKATQTQLIQSEKMASLGELTAGIAHEMQNPLNFVNNFSDVNRELVDELQQGLKAGRVEEAIIISNDIRENEEKINHHGKRADAIVKGMLQHSRTSTGQKEPTDINKLADEYLRLAYQGFRAKDKYFNAKFETRFDPAVGKISIVPEEIGRVLLNLINNAFYAVNERAKQAVPGYEATVIVGTRSLQDCIEISVKDNGNGIPQKILEKIFQPFFTTKPTGQGTGLGLSLAYDIVRAHGGEIKVETNPGVGSQFIILIPVSQ